MVNTVLAFITYKAEWKIQTLALRELLRGVDTLAAFSTTKTHLFKYIENFTTKKNEIFQIKVLIFFNISSQNIDCGYWLEPPRRGGSDQNIDCGYSLEPPRRGGFAEAVLTSAHNLCFEQT